MDTALPLQEMKYHAKLCLEVKHTYNMIEQFFAGETIRFALLKHV
jgi:hypothetical protein